MAKKNITGILDSLVDNEGLKTEVTITLTNETLLKTSAMIIGTTVISSLGYFFVKDLMGGGGK